MHFRRRTYLFSAFPVWRPEASWLCYYRALSSAGFGCGTNDKLSVVLVALFAVAFIGERLSARNWLGVVMVALGAILAPPAPDNCNDRVLTQSGH